MRVAILGNYPQDKSHMEGGTAVVAWRLAHALSKLDGIEVHAISLVPGLPQAYDADCQGVLEHYLPSKKTIGSLTFYYEDRMRVGRLLRRIQPDIVHVHTQLRFPVCAWRTGIPWVLTPHGMIAREAHMYPGLSGAIGHPLWKAYERWAFGVAKDIILISEYTRPFISPFTKARLHTAPNALDDGYFGIPNREEPGMILFVGSLTVRKNVMCLLEAARILRDKGRAYELNIVGSPDGSGYADDLHAFATGHGLDGCVKWHESVSEEQLRDLYARCSMLVLPSLEETLPTVIAQAMAASKPVVGVRSAGIPFMVEDGVTGLLAECGDADGLANRIVQLLDDPLLRARMGDAGKQLAESRYRAQSVARRHVEIYEAAIDGQRS